MKLLVADIAVVLDDLNVSKAHFLGYSMGGRIGFSIAKYAPERFYSLIIGGAHPYLWDSNELDEDLQLFKRGKDAVIEAWEKAGMKMTPETKAHLAANDYEAIAALLPAKHWRLSFEDVLLKMTMPCLLFVGEADPLSLAQGSALKVCPMQPLSPFPASVTLKS